MKLLGIRWDRKFNRRFFIQKLDLYLLGIEKSQRKFVASALSHFAVLGHKAEVQWYLDEDQWELLGQAVLEATLKDLHRLRSHQARMVAEAMKGIGRIRHFEKTNWQELTDTQLLSKYQTFVSAMRQVNSIIWPPVLTDLQLFQYVREKLLTRIPDMEKEKSWETIVTPAKTTPVVQAEIDFYRLLAVHKKRLKGSIQQYLKQYRWIGMRFVDAKPQTSTDVQKRLRLVRRTSWQRRLKKLERDAVQRKRAFTHLLRRLNPQQRNLARLVNAYAYLRQSRDVYRGEAFYLGAPLYREISRRYHIRLFDILAYAVPEVDLLLQKKKSLSKIEITLRRHGFLYVYLNGQRDIITGERRIQKLTRLLDAGVQSLSSRAMVHGTTAYRGKVKGVVRVIRLEHLESDLQTLRRGEIMVSASTKPEYVAAMRRAKAIVTDEGGITSHAAIVSRELKIPCVVSTGNATRVFKTGDRVEVDAERGIVRKIVSNRRAESLPAAKGFGRRGRRHGGAEKGIVRKI